MDKKYGFSAKAETFSDALPDMEESLYCNPLENESETNEKRFCPKNKEKMKKNEKKHENTEFSG